jgi:hypothetical protein
MLPLPPVERRADGHELQPTPLLDYLLDQPAIRDADPAITDVYFDLDETMFRRAWDEQGRQNKELLVGCWRPEMPHTLRALLDRGFSCHILSSDDLPYIGAALTIFAEQFGQDPSDFFGETLSAQGTSFLIFKDNACLEIAERRSADERRAVFVDDAALAFGERPEFDYIRLPSDLTYRGDDCPQQYQAAWVE